MKTIVVGAGLNAYLYGPDHFLSSWGNFMRRFNMVSLADNIPASFAMENNIRYLSNHSIQKKNACQIENLILKEIKNSKFEQAIYHMRYKSDKSVSYPDFIQPLFDTTMGYDDQWKMLEEDFSKKNK